MLDWMNPPEWLTEARVAIAISLVTAATMLIYTRRMAINDTKKMKRKALVSELSPYPDDNTPEGWTRFRVTIRNLEPYAATITGFHARKRNALLAYGPDIEQDVDDGFTTLKKPPPAIIGTRSTAFNLQINPVDTRSPLPLLGSFGAVRHLTLYAKGVERSADITLKWHWTDGQKH